MTQNAVVHADLGPVRTGRRRSPRLGYALAFGGSAIAWAAAALAVAALT